MTQQDISNQEQHEIIDQAIYLITRDLNLDAASTDWDSIKKQAHTKLANWIQRDESSPLKNPTPKWYSFRDTKAKYNQEIQFRQRQLQYYKDTLAKIEADDAKSIITHSDPRDTSLVLNLQIEHPRVDGPTGTNNLSGMLQDKMREIFADAPSDTMLIGGDVTTSDLCITPNAIKQIQKIREQWCNHDFSTSENAYNLLKQHNVKLFQHHKILFQHPDLQAADNRQSAALRTSARLREASQMSRREFTEAKIQKDYGVTTDEVVSKIMRQIMDIQTAETKNIPEGQDVSEENWDNITRQVGEALNTLLAERIGRSEEGKIKLGVEKSLRHEKLWEVSREECLDIINLCNEAIVNAHQPTPTDDHTLPQKKPYEALVDALNTMITKRIITVLPRYGLDRSGR